jgi:hypothetical protein
VLASQSPHRCTRSACRQLLHATTSVVEAKRGPTHRQLHRGTYAAPTRSPPTSPDRRRWSRHSRCHRRRRQRCCSHSRHCQRHCPGRCPCCCPCHCPAFSTTPAATAATPWTREHSPVDTRCRASWTPPPLEPRRLLTLPMPAARTVLSSSLGPTKQLCTFRSHVHSHSHSHSPASGDWGPTVGDSGSSEDANTDKQPQTNVLLKRRV